MTLYLDEPDVRLYHGDSASVLATLPPDSVHCCVTSPPFWGLRDYGTGTWEGGDETCGHYQGRPGSGRADGKVDERAQRNRDGATALTSGRCSACGARRVDQQIGLEPTPDEWVERLVAVFREVRRVLRPDGVCFVECGDSYAGSGGFAPDAPINQARARGEGWGKLGASSESARSAMRGSGHKRLPGLKPKDLIGQPWLLAFALRADGWWLRDCIIWARPNPMPESATDRTTKSHSYVFVCTKRARYAWDADAIREAADGRHADDNPSGRNARSVWTIPTEPTPFAHFATMPTALAERCIRAGTSEHGCCAECGAPWERVVERGLVPHQETWNVRSGDDGGVRAANFKRDAHIPGTPTATTIGWRPTCPHDAPTTPAIVLDPFAGAATTMLAARRLGRHSVGVELSAEYLGIAKRRLERWATPSDVSRDADQLAAMGQLDLLGGTT